MMTEKQMSNEATITATIQLAEQIGPDTWQMKRYSRNFEAHRSLSDVVGWAQSMGIKNATINDVVLHDYTGASL